MPACSQRTLECGHCSRRQHVFIHNSFRVRVVATCARCHSCVESQLTRYAREAAQLLLATQAPDAWERSMRAAGHADSAVMVLGRPRGEVIVSAAWLHAIGESPTGQRTGFAPVDAAVHLLAEGWPTPVVNLVAHQAQARLVAPAFTASERLALFERIQGWPSDILDYAIVLSLAEGDDQDPESCVRLAGRRLTASLRMSARDRAERERRLRRAVDRVDAAIISARASIPAVM